jgi:hypothetical protein
MESEMTTEDMMAKLIVRQTEKIKMQHTALDTCHEKISAQADEIAELKGELDLQRKQLSEMTQRFSSSADDRDFQCGRVDELQAQNSKLREGLKKLEYITEDEEGIACCSICGALRGLDHKPDCWLAELLKEGE